MNEFSSDTLETLICHHLSELDGNITFNRITTGKFNTSFFVDVGSEQFVLRIAPSSAKETLSVSTGGELQVTDDSIGIGAEVRIPSRGDANWRFYTGAIDNVRVLNAALTTSEVRDSMENGILSVEPKA